MQLLETNSEISLTSDPSNLSKGSVAVNEAPAVDMSTTDVGPQHCNDHTLEVNPEVVDIVSEKSTLDPCAFPFRPLQSSLSKASAIAHNLGEDWSEIQQVSAGGKGSLKPVVSRW